MYEFSACFFKIKFKACPVKKYMYACIRLHFKVDHTFQSISLLNFSQYIYIFMDLYARRNDVCVKYALRQITPTETLLIIVLGLHQAIALLASTQMTAKRIDIFGNMSSYIDKYASLLLKWL